MKISFWMLFLVCVLPSAPAGAATLDGATLGVAWAIPFLGLLMSIALGPLLMRKTWHSHYGKIAAIWSALALLPLAIWRGADIALASFMHAMLAEYFSFIVLLFALYTVTGGITITGRLRGTPRVNTAILAAGTLLASVAGTTGAAMILIRPLLRANAGRTHNVHVVVFFIILVANIGGALTPLGDPPLFLGFLRGVDFFWPLQNTWRQTAIVAAALLVLFFILDTIFSRHDGEISKSSDHGPLGVKGVVNFALMAAIIVAILLSASWQPGIEFDIFGTKLALQNLSRDIALLLIAGLSLALTRKDYRAANDFSWEPIREVSILFAGIFVAIVPVLAMLQAGRAGLFGFLLDAVTAKDNLPHEAAYFWLTGLLSAFLDNAPTYVVFFELAGGDAKSLMGPLAGTLAAISMGAVYMGALTYIGNAPNFMVYAIATDRGVAMPSFFMYLLWAAIILFPVFVLLTLLPIPPFLAPI